MFSLAAWYWRIGLLIDTGVFDGAVLFTKIPDILQRVIQFILLRRGRGSRVCGEGRNRFVTRFGLTPPLLVPAALPNETKKPWPLGVDPR